MKFLHDIGIVHSDLKLDNIMVNPTEKASSPVVKIIDFGLSKSFDPD